MPRSILLLCVLFLGLNLQVSAQPYPLSVPTVELTNNVIVNGELGLSVRLQFSSQFFYTDKVMLAVDIDPVGASTVRALDQNYQTKTGIEARRQFTVTNARLLTETMFIPHQAIVLGGPGGRCDVNVQVRAWDPKTKAAFLIVAQHLTRQTVAANPPPAPAAEISSYRIEQNMELNGMAGMNLHVDFKLWNAQGRSCTISGWFFDLNGAPVKAADVNYRANNGDVSVGRAVKPTSDSASYTDLILFIPYRAFALRGDAPTEMSLELEVRDVAAKKALRTTKRIGFTIKNSNVARAVAPPATGGADSSGVIVSHPRAVNHAKQGNLPGIMVYVDVTARNANRSPFKIYVYFRDAQQRNLRADPPYRSRSGTVFGSTSLTLDSGRATPAAIFIPYEAFNLGDSENASRLSYTISVFDETENRTVRTSDPYNFTIALP